VHRYKSGEKWWLETSELEAMATAEQEARRARDEWELPIREWVSNRIEVTLREVIRRALGLSVTHSAEIRVTKILKHHLGFRQCKPNRKGKRYYCYRREQPLMPVHDHPRRRFCCRVLCWAATDKGAIAASTS
jgi:predicted P-loop ATPase